MKKLILILFLFSSCSQKLVEYNLELTVKEYEHNELKSCGKKPVTIQLDKSSIKFFDLSLKAVGWDYIDQSGNLYKVTNEINDHGLIISAVSRDNKSYIISTSGTCH